MKHAKKVGLAAGLVLMFFVITITSVLIKQHKEKQEKLALTAEMSNLEKQLETKEIELQSISSEIDTQISDLGEVLRKCQLAANYSLSAIICSTANSHYSEAQQYLDTFYTKREELDVTLSEYKLVYETASELCSSINSIREKLELNEEVLHAVSFETKMAHINERLENQKVLATELTVEAKAYANELYKEYYPLMVQIVACEAGAPYCSNEDQYYVANVVENRILSKYYPNDIYSVIFQRGQYSPTWNGAWQKTKPDERTKENIERYLRGEVETGMPENVLYQAMFKQGSGVWAYVDNSVDGGHYYCYR